MPKPPVMFSEIGDALHKAELAGEEVTDLLRAFVAGKFPTTDPDLAHAARRLASVLARDFAQLACSLEAVVRASEAEARSASASVAKWQDVLRCDWDRCARPATHRAETQHLSPQQQRHMRFCCADHAEYFRSAIPLSELEPAALALEVKP